MVGDLNDQGVVGISVPSPCLPPTPQRGNPPSLYLDLQSIHLQSLDKKKTNSDEPSSPSARNSELRERTGVKYLPGERDTLKVYTESHADLSPIPVRIKWKSKTQQGYEAKNRL